jgi:hypothetical protein
MIKKGTKISFQLNGRAVSGVIDEVNGYGIKCIYQTESGLKKIYLKPINLTIIK